MVLLGVLGAEQTLLAPEEAIGGVLVATHVQQRGRHDGLLGDVATGSGDGLVVAGFDVVGHHVGQNPLTRQTTATDPLALLGHGVKLPVGRLRNGGMGTAVSGRSAAVGKGRRVAGAAAGVGNAHTSGTRERGLSRGTGGRGPASRASEQRRDPQRGARFRRAQEGLPEVERPEMGDHRRGRPRRASTPWRPPGSRGRDFSCCSLVCRKLQAGPSGRRLAVRSRTARYWSIQAS